MVDCDPLEKKNIGTELDINYFENFFILISDHWVWVMNNQITTSESSSGDNYVMGVLEEMCWIRWALLVDGAFNEIQYFLELNREFIQPLIDWIIWNLWSLRIIWGQNYLNVD